MLKRKIKILRSSRWFKKIKRRLQENLRILFQVKMNKPLELIGFIKVNLSRIEWLVIKPLRRRQWGSRLWLPLRLSAQGIAKSLSKKMIKVTRRSLLRALWISIRGNLAIESCHLNRERTSTRKNLEDPQPSNLQMRHRQISFRKTKKKIGHSSPRCSKRTMKKFSNKRI